MRWEGLTPELITSNPACLLKLCLAMMKSFCYLPYYFTFCNYDIGSGKGCPDPAFPLLSRESRIPNFCHRHPGCRFLSKSRICAHLTFPVSRTVFWSNSGILVIPCILDVNLIALFFSWFRKSERTPVMGREWVNISPFFSYCYLGRLGWSRRCW